MNEAIRFNTIRPTVAVELTEEEIDELLDDMPGGQSVSEVTRRFHQCLREARQSLRVQREAAEQNLAGIPAPALVLLDSDTST